MPSQSAAPTTGNRVVFGCLMLFGFTFLAGGLLTLVQSARHYSADSNSIVGIVVGGVFTLVGGLLMIAIAYGRAAARMTEERKAGFPDKPWMWREDWANRAIKDASRGAMIALWVFAIVWNAVAIPIAWTMKPQASRDNPATLLIFLFPLAGLLVLIAAIYHTIQQARFGSSVCHLDRVPIVPGRMFRGDLELKTDLVPANGYHLRLALMNLVTTRSGTRRSTTERVAWDEQIVVEASAAMRSPMGTRVPFQFATPPDAHPTDDRNYNNRYLWRLMATADLPGVDFSAQFELPVFATGEEVDGSDFAAFQQRHRQEAARQTIAPASGVEITRLPSGGERFRIHAKKTFGGVFGNLLFLLLWNASIVAMIRFHVPWGFPVFFIFIDLILILGSIDYYFGRSTIEADARGVRMRKEWLGIGGEATYDAASIASIDGVTAGTSNNAFGVKIKLGDGKTRNLCSSLPSREAAETVAARMMADIGRTSFTAP